jgi:tetratricopeptide (TPR) repeat protein
MNEILIKESSIAFETSRELAVGLWSKGDYDDARKVLLDIRVNMAGLDGEQLLTLYINLAMVERSAGNFEEALTIHRQAAPLAEACANFVLKAKYHNGLAITYRRLKQYDSAFQEYTAVSVFMEHAGDLKGCAEAQNNIGNLMIDAGNPSEAHTHLDIALRVCSDPASEAQIYDTRARALAAEGKIGEAQRAATSALLLTLQADNERLLYEHLATFFEVGGVSFDADKLKHAIEARDIRKALTESKGSIYRASMSLGLTWQGLQWKLENQHQDLLFLRNPKRRSPAAKLK